MKLLFLTSEGFDTTSVADYLAETLQEDKNVPNNVETVKQKGVV